MNKSDIYRKINDQFPSLSASLVEKFVNRVFAEMAKSLADENRIELRGFGSFSVRYRNERVGRNPRTGQSVVVTAKKMPFFRFGKPLLHRLNNSHGSLG